MTEYNVIKHPLMKQIEDLEATVEKLKKENWGLEYMKGETAYLLDEANLKIEELEANLQEQKRIKEENAILKRQNESLKKQSELILQLKKERRKLTAEELEIERARIKELMKNDSNKDCKSAPSVPDFNTLNEPYDF